LLVLTYFSIVQEALSALYVLKHTRTFDGRFCSQSCDGEVTVESLKKSETLSAALEQPGLFMIFGKWSGVLWA
jgi:hypothetical protein